MTLSAVALMSICQSEASARAFYVSPQGDGTTGQDWAKAWQDPAKIDWTQVNPGDQIVLDGGPSGITYETGFTIAKSGTQHAPITIRQSPHAGHNGQITLFGKSVGQMGYKTGIETGINLTGSYVNIAGARRGGIKMLAYSGTCINIDPSVQNSTIRNIEIENRVYLPWYGAITCSGMQFAGFNNHIIDCDFRECNTSAKEMAKAGTTNRVVFNGCTFGSRQHYLGWTRGCGTAIISALATAPDHPSAIIAHRCIFGPYISAGVIMYKGNLQVSDSLFLAPPLYGIDAEPQTAVTDVRVNRCTFITPFHPVVLSPTNPFPPRVGMLGFPIRTNGVGIFKVANSIFYAGTISVPANMKVNAGGNFTYNIAGNTTALAASLTNPQLTDGAAIDAMPDVFVPYTLSTLNYAPIAGSPAAGKGSSITSVSQLTTPYGPKDPIPTVLGGP